MGLLGLATANQQPFQLDLTGTGERHWFQHNQVMAPAKDAEVRDKQEYQGEQESSEENEAQSWMYQPLKNGARQHGTEYGRHE